MTAVKVMMENFFRIVLNDRRLEYLDDYLLPDFIHHTPLPGMGTDRTGFMQELSVFFIAYYDTRYQLDALHLDGQTVTARWTAEATHPGTLVGRKGEPLLTGRRVRWSGALVAALRDGRMAELWWYQQELRLAEQLQALPIALCEN